MFNERAPFYKHLYYFVSESVCPFGWHQHRDACVLLSPSPRSFAAAKSDCATFGAQLIEIPDKDTNDFLGQRYGLL